MSKAPDIAQGVDMLTFGKVQYSDAYTNDKLVLVFVDGEEIGNLYHDDNRFMTGYTANYGVVETLGISESLVENTPLQEAKRLLKQAYNTVKNGGKLINGFPPEPETKEKSMSKREQYRKVLEKRGYKKIPGKSRKYIVMTKAGSESNVYLGKSGAVRMGKTISKSWAVGEETKNMLLKEAAGE